LKPVKKTKLTKGGSYPRLIEGDCAGASLGDRKE